MKCTKNFRRFLLAIAVLALALPLASWGGQKDEEQLGRDYAKDVEKNSKLSTDAALVERVQRVGANLAKIANEDEVPASYGSSKIYKFKYEFKVVEDDDVNAFSLPGGIVYVNTGLMKFIDSDDELAGVLAHEIAHAAHHHMMALQRKSSQADKYVALIALAGILTNARSEDLRNMLMGAQMMRVGKLNSYTQEAEKDADRTAVAYLVKSSYKPQGMLDFMKKLEKQHDENPTEQLGIFQTHPAPFRRVASIAKAMQEQGLDVNMRKLRDVACAKEAPIAKGSDIYKVVINERVLYEPAGLPAGTSSKERAAAIAAKVNALLDKGTQAKDISEDFSNGRLMAKGVEVVKIETEDRSLNGSDTSSILDKARSALNYAVWADWLCNDCKVTQDTKPDN